ncbi:MAG: hypothetical protein QXZ40_01265 [Candidatus Micrarchaeia archaeon]
MSMAYEKLIEKLRRKGWSNRDIVETIKIMEEADAERKKKSGWLYWVALVLMIVGMLVVSIVLIPLILTLNMLAVYSIMVVVAYSFGTMFSVVLSDLESIEGKKIITPIFIPAIGVVNMYYVIKATEVLAAGKQIPNPLVISIVYALLFTAPYAFSRLSGLIKIE